MLSRKGGRSDMREDTPLGVFRQRELINWIWNTLYTFECGYTTTVP